MQVGIPVFGRSLGSLEPLMSDYAAGYGPVGGEGPDAVQFLGGYSCDDKAGLKRERDLRRKIFTVAGVEARQEDGRTTGAEGRCSGGLLTWRHHSRDGDLAQWRPMTARSRMTRARLGGWVDTAIRGRRGSENT